MVCEKRNYIPELVYLLSKTGETKRALFLIIDKLGDVSQAIAFAKSQDDVDLWDDLLNYSMNKPRFIRGLLEEVGTAVDPVQLVRRIPEGLEIEGLKSGLSKILKEYELQYSISEGVAKILRGEVALALETSRIGRVKGVKFDVGTSLQVSVYRERDHRRESKGAAIGEETAKDSSSASDSCLRCGKGFLNAGEWRTRLREQCVLICFQHQKLWSDLRVDMSSTSPACWTTLATSLHSRPL